MKRGKKDFKISNRVLYTLITLGILIVAGIGVYAASYAASGAGHPYTEISTCNKNQILKMNSAGTAWECATDNSGGSCSYSLTSCETVTVGYKTDAMISCPSGKVGAGIYISTRASSGVPVSYVQSMRCCKISLSCS